MPFQFERRPHSRRLTCGDPDLRDIASLALGRDQPIVSLVISDPEPQISIAQLDCQCTIFQRNSRRPNLVVPAFSNFLELQGWMLRIGLDQGKLFVGANTNISW
jgi:hypothetical protein